MHNATVSTCVFGTGVTEHPLPDIHLKLASERISAQALIRRTVEAQINQMLQDQQSTSVIKLHLNAQYLVQSEIDRQKREGKIALEKAPQEEQISIEAEAAKALQAFQKKGFKMFVDGNEVGDLEEDISLTDKTTISFIRLIPLVGG